MEVEYEAKFININKDKARRRLKKAGAKLIRPEFLQKRITFNLPEKYAATDRWVRVRDEGDKITMSLKIVDGDKIQNQKEVNLDIDSFKKAEDFLSLLGCEKKSYQETKREIWQLGEVEITIDEWPFLEPFVEIEGKSEEEVKAAAKKLGFDYAQALFCSVTPLYNQKYKIPEETLNNQYPRIVFGMKNPFLP